MLEALSKAKLSYLRKLRQKKFREQEGLFALEGWHLLEDAIASDWVVRMIVVERGRKLSVEQSELLNKVRERDIIVYEAEKSQLDGVADTIACQGVLALAERVRRSWDSFLSEHDGQAEVRLIAMDAVGDPGNCGSILRSADWFGLDGAILGSGSAELENGKTARSTMGALFHIPVFIGGGLPERLEALRDRGFKIFSAELGGAENLFEFSWPEKAVLVIGNEAHGVSEEVSSLCDGRIMIPRFGGAESLNAAMAASVMLSHWRMVNDG